ncbi:MAG: ABC transporter substrate-binding protein [Chloroflexi bacterium]|nr:ABC transporter substrate-binding protein [Chloroflexota bacterium]
MKRVGTGLVMAVIGVGLLFALACAPQESAPPAGSGPGQATSQPAQPKSGGTLTLAVNFDPSYLDPHKGTAQPTSGGDMMDHTYDTLLNFAPSLTDYRFEGNLAASWEQPDARTYIFRLRQGVRWHDLPPVKGREFVADDVKYSIERIRTKSKDFGQQWRFADVAQIEVLDKYSVKFVLTEPSANFLNRVANRAVRIVPRELIEQQGDLNGPVQIGTGPFLWKSYTRGSGTTFEKNPNYHLTGRPYVEKVNLLIVPEAAARLSAFRAGQIDLLEVGFRDQAAVKRTNPNVVVTRIPGGAGDLVDTGFRINLAKPPLDDLRVRQALQLAVDYDAIMQQIYDGDAQQASYVSPSLQEWFLPGLTLPKRDVVKAKQLLAQAGYASGLRLVAKASTGRSAWADTGTLLKTQLAEVGIEVDLRLMEHGAWIAAQVAKDFDILPSGPAKFGPGGDGDPEPLYSGYHCKGGRNFYNLCDAQLDELLDKQRVTVDPEQRKRLIHDVQRRLVELLPEIPIAETFHYDLAQPWVQGYQPSLASRFRYNYNIWLDK